MSEATIARERHAAHTGPGTGWDLEWIDTTEEQPVDLLRSGFKLHSGYRKYGVQHWMYCRRAPLSEGTCERCIQPAEGEGR